MDFDRLPQDLFYYISTLLGIYEIVNMCCLFSSWRVSINLRRIRADRPTELLILGYLAVKRLPDSILNFLVSSPNTLVMARSETSPPDGAVPTNLTRIRANIASVLDRIPHLVHDVLITSAQLSTIRHPYPRKTFRLCWASLDNLNFGAMVNAVKSARIRLDRDDRVLLLALSKLERFKPTMQGIARLAKLDKLDQQDVNTICARLDISPTEIDNTVGCIGYKFAIGLSNRFPHQAEMILQMANNDRRVWEEQRRIKARYEKGRREEIATMWNR